MQYARHLQWVWHAMQKTSLLDSAALFAHFPIKPAFKWVSLFSKSLAVCFPQESGSLFIAFVQQSQVGVICSSKCCFVVCVQRVSLSHCNSCLKKPKMGWWIGGMNEECAFFWFLPTWSSHIHTRCIGLQQVGTKQTLHLDQLYFQVSIAASSCHAICPRSSVLVLDFAELFCFRWINWYQYIYFFPTVSTFTQWRSCMIIPCLISIVDLLCCFRQQIKIYAVYLIIVL